MRPYRVSVLDFASPTGYSHYWLDLDHVLGMTEIQRDRGVWEFHVTMAFRDDPIRFFSYHDGDIDHAKETIWQPLFDAWTKQGEAA